MSIPAKSETKNNNSLQKYIQQHTSIVSQVRSEKSRVYADLTTLTLLPVVDLLFPINPQLKRNQ